MDDPDHVRKVASAISVVANAKTKARLGKKKKGADKKGLKQLGGYSKGATDDFSVRPSPAPSPAPPRADRRAGVWERRRRHHEHGRGGLHVIARRARLIDASASRPVLGEVHGPVLRGVPVPEQGVEAGRRRRKPPRLGRRLSRRG